MTSMTTQTCGWCHKPFQVHTADVARGWGKFCSKSCKASEQEKRTGQNRTHRVRRTERDHDDEQRMHDEAMDSATAGWDEGGWLSDDSGVTS